MLEAVGHRTHYHLRSLSRFTGPKTFMQPSTCIQPFRMPCLQSFMKNYRVAPFSTTPFVPSYSLFGSSSSSSSSSSSRMEFVDVHCHLLHERFAGEEEVIVKSCIDAGLCKIIINGLNPSNNRAILKFCNEFPVKNVVHAAAGIYPIDACSLAIRNNRALWKAQFEPPDYFAIEEELDFIDTLASTGQIIAVGECGLDRFYIDTPETNDEQEMVLRRLMKIAKTRRIPIILHSRKAEQRVFEMLCEEGVQKALFHCFCGKMKLAKSIASAGYYLSIPGGAVHDVPSNQFRKMVEFLPIERLLTETDSPYMGPEKGIRNDPRSVIRGVDVIAAIKKMEVSDLQSQIRNNFKDLFGV